MLAKLCGYGGHFSARAIERHYARRGVSKDARRARAPRPGSPGLQFRAAAREKTKTIDLAILLGWTPPGRARGCNGLGHQGGAGRGGRGSFGKRNIISHVAFLFSVALIGFGKAYTLRTSPL
jgi:hypothetical protein